MHLDTETIEKAAILLDGVIHTIEKPARHFSIIQKLVGKGYEKPIQGNQGFVTSEGRFVDRVEGAKIAVKSGQIKKLKWPPKLYSEDLW
ncbi:MAG: hypothetical protein H7831_11640 [Magnetococcus sp. WYHC-3]